VNVVVVAGKVLAQALGDVLVREVVVVVGGGGGVGGGNVVVVVVVVVSKPFTTGVWIVLTVTEYVAPPCCAILPMIDDRMSCAVVAIIEAVSWESTTSGVSVLGAMTS